MIPNNGKTRKPGIRAVLIVFAIFVFFGAAQAGDLPDIDPINPVLGVKPPAYRFERLPEGVVIREGTIQVVGPDWMVISDRTRWFAPTIRYLAEYDGFGEDPRKFVPGTFVGYRQDENRKIAEIWLIPNEQY